MYVFQGIVFVFFYYFLLYFRTVSTVWYFRTVSTVWYFRQCGILELFRQCGILELFRQCGIFRFSLYHVHLHPCHLTLNILNCSVIQSHCMFDHKCSIVNVSATFGYPPSDIGDLSRLWLSYLDPLVFLLPRLFNQLAFTYFGLE